MAKVPATQFKAKCLELMDRVSARHETFVITKRGKPVAKLVPMERRRKDTIFGWLRDRGSVTDDLKGPAVGPPTWETLSEWDEITATRAPGKTKRSRPSTRARRQR